MKPVSELLKKREGTLWHVRPDDSVYSALQLLAQHEVGALVVMDGGRLVGIVSERDYTRKIALQGRSSKDTTVAEIMTAQVLKAALDQKTESLTGDLRSLMREKNIRHGGISRSGQTIDIRFRDAATLTAAKNLIQDQFPDLQAVEGTDGSDLKLTATIRPESARKVVMMVPWRDTSERSSTMVAPRRNRPRTSK